MATTIKVSKNCHNSLRRMKAAGNFDTYEELIWYLMKQAKREDFTSNLLEGVL